MTTIEKYHDEARPDRWTFTLGSAQPGAFTAYEIALCALDTRGNEYHALNGVEPAEDDNTVWGVYGFREDYNSREAGMDSSGPTEHIADRDSIHAALGLLVKIGAITLEQKHEVERAWITL